MEAHLNKCTKCVTLHYPHHKNILVLNTILVTSTCTLKEGQLATACHFREQCAECANWQRPVTARLSYRWARDGTGKVRTKRSSEEVVQAERRNV